MPHRPEDLDTALSADMQALIARVLAEDGPGVDTSLMPPAEGRARTLADNARWNIDLPELALRTEVTVPGDTALGSVATRTVVTAPPGETRGTILFVHGGGFAFCSPETHLRTSVLLGQTAGAMVVSPEYRLAPEDPYPAGLKDVVGVLRTLVRDPGSLGCKPGPIVLAGDSAGANLALAALLHEGGDLAEEVAGALLFYGVYTADFSTPSYRVFENGPGLTTPKMQRYWDWYVADAAKRTDPLMAPIHAPDAALKALPPLYLTAAGVDPLLSDTLLLVDRLRAIGRDDPFDLEPGVVHGFLQRSVALDAARDALATAGQHAARMIKAR